MVSDCDSTRDLDWHTVAVKVVDVDVDVEVGSEDAWLYDGGESCGV